MNKNATLLAKKIFISNKDLEINAFLDLDLPINWNEKTMGDKPLKLYEAAFLKVNNEEYFDKFINRLKSDMPSNFNEELSKNSKFLINFLSSSDIYFEMKKSFFDKLNFTSNYWGNINKFDPVFYSDKWPIIEERLKIFNKDLCDEIILNRKKYLFIYTSKESVFKANIPDIKYVNEEMLVLMSNNCKKGFVNDFFKKILLTPPPVSLSSFNQILNNLKFFDNEFNNSRFYNVSNNYNYLKLIQNVEIDKNNYKEALFMFNDLLNNLINNVNYSPWEERKKMYPAIKKKMDVIEGLLNEDDILDFAIIKNKVEFTLNKSTKPSDEVKTLFSKVDVNFEVVNNKILDFEKAIDYGRVKEILKSLNTSILFHASSSLPIEEKREFVDNILNSTKDFDSFFNWSYQFMNYASNEKEYGVYAAPYWKALTKCSNSSYYLNKIKNDERFFVPLVNWSSIEKDVEKMLSGRSTENKNYLSKITIKNAIQEWGEELEHKERRKRKI